MHQQQAALENIEGKGEIAHNEHFLLFPQSDNCIPICPHISNHIKFAAQLEEPKIGISGKGLSNV